LKHYLTVYEEGVSLAKAVFSNNGNIRVNYDNGTINFANRVGGYLGKNFSMVASDVFGVSVDALSYSQLLVVKTALNSCSE